AASPARGKEMRANLLAKLRPPPLIHSWDFWHDRQDRPARSSDQQQQPANSATETKYEDRLVHLSSISDVKAFWSMFNNFDVSKLPLRDSVHLFHKGVKPVWEDPRNAKGGSWTFRVPKDKAPAFWKEICMLAIGESLQSAVESDRKTFRDDICGVSLSVRFTSMLIQVWNRDAEHVQGVEKILKTVLENLPDDLQPKESSYYYKKHAEHKGFGSS
ncbi:translation initiation factor eIF4e, partial [Myriangium duriaei CBS 260.36]